MKYFFSIIERPFCWGLNKRTNSPTGHCKLLKEELSFEKKNYKKFTCILETENLISIDNVRNCCFHTRCDIEKTKTLLDLNKEKFNTN